MQILSQLPEMITYQRKCAQSGTDIACKLNSKLLKYFIQKEFTDKQIHPENSNSQEPSIIKPKKSLDEAEPDTETKEKEVKKDNGATMLITNCPHTERKHYAKGMCSSCYRKFGRNQLAWNCEHTTRLNYSIGMCQTCYLSDYHKRRITAKKEKKQLDKKKDRPRSVSGDRDSVASKDEKAPSEKVTSIKAPASNEE